MADKDKRTLRGRFWEAVKNKYRAGVATTKAYVRVGAKDLADKTTDGLAGSSEPGTVGNPTQQQVTEGFDGTGKERAAARATREKPAPAARADRAVQKGLGRDKGHSHG